MVTSQEPVLLNNTRTTNDNIGFLEINPFRTLIASNAR